MASDTATATAPAATPARDSIRIRTATGEHVIRVELALDGASQRKGLMFRRQLAADQGMLFVYTPPRQIGMWMKNTFLSLDMVFSDESGRVIGIAEHTEPFSERVISVPGPVYAVLEVNGGTAERLGMKPGDQILGPLFHPAR